MKKSISRRTALKGLGTAIALPFLESFAVGAPAGASLAAGAPKRVAFCYVPNGVVMPGVDAEGRRQVEGTHRHPRTAERRTRTT